MHTVVGAIPLNTTTLPFDKHTYRKLASFFLNLRRAYIKNNTRKYIFIYNIIVGNIRVNVRDYILYVQRLIAYTYSHNQEDYDVISGLAYHLHQTHRDKMRS